MATGYVRFERDIQSKLLTVIFEPGSVLATVDDIEQFRAAWTQELRAWHTPYKAIVDARGLVAVSSSESVVDAGRRMARFLSGFFLRKAVVVGTPEQQDYLVYLPFPVFVDEDAARQDLGVRAKGPLPVGARDLRAMIRVENHFGERIVEIATQSGEKVSLETVEDIEVLRSKLTNNLSQWHSAWSLLIDVDTIDVGTAAPRAEWERMVRFFRGFFLTQIAGYGRVQDEEIVPFKVFRTRHAALAALKDGDGEGSQSRTDDSKGGDCASRRSS